MGNDQRICRYLIIKKKIFFLFNINFSFLNFFFFNYKRKGKLTKNNL